MKNQTTPTTRRVFRQGDIVQLKTGGPTMAVASSVNNENIVLCQFFLRTHQGDHTRYHRENIPPCNLTLLKAVDAE